MGTMNALVERNGSEILKRGLSDLHKALADWILLNPGGTLRAMGAHFGYSPAWLCTVTNSDMFRAYMEERRNGVDAAILDDLPARLRAAAHIATERVIEVIEKSEDADTLIDAFDRVLHRYGYAPNAKTGAQPAAAGFTQNNVFFLTRDEFAGAKQKLIEAHAEAVTEAAVLPLPVEANGPGEPPTT